MNIKTIAVVGNGCAGVECVKALRESGYPGEIHLFTDSRWPVYNPMLTTYFVAGKIGFDQLFPPGNNNNFYRDYRVEVHSASPVIALDAVKRVIANKAGVELGYDRCLIASGASPLLPPVPGINYGRVHVIRTPDDAVRLKEALDKRPLKALVIGASMVGIKVVELFYKAGVKVCLADLADRIFPLTAHEECSRLIEERLQGMGIKLRFGAGIQRIEEIPGGIRVWFNDSDKWEDAELLVMCIGVRANMAFIDRSQVELKQGVLVDEYMQTSVPGLYAAGDVSQGRNCLTGMQQVIGLLANARYQGRTAGKNMAGFSETFPGNIPHNITHFLGMDFIGIGDVCQFDKMEKKYDGRKYLQLFWKGGLLTGANFLECCTEAGIVKNAVVKGLLQNSSGYGGSSLAVQNLLLRKILAEVERK